MVGKASKKQEPEVEEPKDSGEPVESEKSDGKVEKKSKKDEGKDAKKRKAEEVEEEEEAEDKKDDKKKSKSSKEDKDEEEEDEKEKKVESIGTGRKKRKAAVIAAAKNKKGGSTDLNSALLGLLCVSERLAPRKKRKGRKRKAAATKEKEPLDPQQRVVSHKSWTIIEEVFLVGVVVDMFLSRGSLSPKHYGESCWTLIKENYDQAWNKYLNFLAMERMGELKAEGENEKTYPFLRTIHHSTIENHERTQGAMARHFKEMKDRCAKGTTRNFSHFLREWEEIYNVNYCLLDPLKSKEAKKEDEPTIKAAPLTEELKELKKRESMYEGRWSHQDEVFLIAAVVTRFLKTGSLASPRGSADQACWTNIHQSFEHLQAQALTPDSKPRPRRSITALLRRFKLIKEHQSTKKSIRALYKDWKENYKHYSITPGATGTPKSLSVATSVSKPDAKGITSKSPLQPNQKIIGPDGKEKLASSLNLSGDAKGDDANQPPPVAPEEIVQQMPTEKQKAMLDAAPIRVRIKWTPWDVCCLWNGIAQFGNSWSEIRKQYLPLRTTDQVKDKGKRLLRRVGWQTGRTKKFFFKASEEAKEIAKQTCEQKSIPKITHYYDKDAVNNKGGMKDDEKKKESGDKRGRQYVSHTHDLSNPSPPADMPDNVPPPPPAETKKPDAAPVEASGSKDPPAVAEEAKNDSPSEETKVDDYLAKTALVDDEKKDEVKEGEAPESAEPAEKEVEEELTVANV